MSNLKWAIEYMRLRCKCLDLERELCEMRNENPLELRARYGEAHDLLEQLQRFEKDN